MTWSPLQKMSIGAGALLLVLAAFGVVAWLSTSRLIQQEALVARTNSTIAHLDGLVGRVADAEGRQRAYLLSGADVERAGFDSARGDVESVLDVLRDSSRALPRQARALDTLTQLLGTRFAVLQAGIAARRLGGMDSARAFLARDSVRAREAYIRLARQMRDEELRLLAERTRVQSESGRLASTAILVFSLFAFVLALVAFQPLRPSVAHRLSQRLSTPVSVAQIEALEREAEAKTRPR